MPERENPFILVEKPINSVQEKIPFSINFSFHIHIQLHTGRTRQTTKKQELFNPYQQRKCNDI